MKNFIRLVSFVLTLLALPGHASEAIEDFQAWGNITATGSLTPLNPKLEGWRYWLEGQGRFGNDSSRFSQSLIRGGLGYDLMEKLNLWLGYAYITTDRPFARDPFDEHRVWQQLLWTKPFALGTFMSRTRMEQRFMEIGNETGWRFRQFFKLTVPLEFAPDFMWVAYNEVFVDLNKTDWKPANGFDQNRFFTGLGYRFTPNIHTEIGYMNQFIRRKNNPDFVNHNLSVNFYLNY